MKEIVPQECVAHAGLFGSRFQRRMRMNHPHRHQEAVVRNTVHADSPVVARNIFHQPVDGVVSVRAFIYPLGVGSIMDRAVHDELAFGTVAPANILKHENVAFWNHVRVTAQRTAVALVWCGNSVWRAFKKYWERSWTLGGVNLGVELDSVA